MMKRCKAKMTANVLNDRVRKLVSPVKSPNDEKGNMINMNIYPRYTKKESSMQAGKLIHGGYLVIEGEEYNVDESLLGKKDKGGNPTGLSIIFEPIKSKKE